MNAEQRLLRQYHRTMVYQMSVALFEARLPPEVVVRMTPAQLMALVFHKRDEKGRLKPPGDGLRSGKPSLEKDLAFFRSLPDWDSSRPNCQRKERAIYQRYGVPYPGGDNGGTS